MARIDMIKRQHKEIRDLMARMSAELEAGQLSKDAAKVRHLLSELGGKLTIHLAMEDKSLYPDLLKHPHERVRTTAKEYMEEMGGIADNFTNYIRKWPHPTAIQNSPEQFIRESGNILAVLSMRIDKEENELFPLAESLG